MIVPLTLSLKNHVKGEKALDLFNTFAGEKMMKIIKLIATILWLSVLSNLALGVTEIPLNTGYNHSPTVQALYPVPSVPSTTQDNYWINIASFPTTPVPVGPAFVLQQTSPWAAPMSNTVAGSPVGSRWISAWNVMTSPSGTSPSNPAYTIFRKCFCLLPGFNSAQLRFNVRADDNIQVWFNSQLNTVLAPVIGVWGGPGFRSGGTTQNFVTGKNCLYVLVEDLGGHMGFNMVGTVSANGLLQTPAAGVGQSFAPCNCNSGPGTTLGTGAQSSRTSTALEIASDDQQVINEILKIAEARRTAAIRKKR